MAAAIFLSVIPQTTWPQEILLTLGDTPVNGYTVGRVDLTAAVRWCKRTPVLPERLVGFDVANGGKVPLQFVPDADYNTSNHIAGTLVAKLSKPGPVRLKIEFAEERSTGSASGRIEPWDGRVITPEYSVEHDAKRQGGFPWRIIFTASGKVVDSIRWNNRLHHRQEGSFCVCDDPDPGVERVSTGPLCTVIRVRGRFVQGNRQPPSRPAAIYDWYYFADAPLAYVTATIRQAQPFTWQEVHFLELNYPGEILPRWAGGDPLAEGRFEGTLKSFPQAQWGMVHDGTNSIAMFHCGQALLHDGGKGSYLQAHGDTTWQEWGETKRESSAWLRIGAVPPTLAGFGDTANAMAHQGQWSVTVDSIHSHIESVRGKLDSLPQARRRQAWWRVQGARQLEAQGHLAEAWQVAEGRKPTNWTTLQAGDLGLILDHIRDGIRVLSLFDTAKDQAFVSSQPLPLFAITVRETGKETMATLTADKGWQEAEITKKSGSSQDSGSSQLELRWRKPVDASFGDLQVVARVVADPKTGSLRWSLAVDPPAAPWSLWRVRFPQVALPEAGSQGVVLFPKAAGEVQRGVWQRPFRFSGTYPSGWTSMQFMAAYDEERQTGLYVAAHDPWGSTKDLLMESQPTERSVVLTVDHPVPNMGVTGNRYVLPGEAVWQLLRGDWFDASVIYRKWVRAEAKWYPKLTAQGREDTPLWMRELSAWSLGSGPSSQCVPEVQAFTTYLSPPTATHWYNWHEIPFDNDYPHYFPTRPGFAEGVRELQDSGTSVMPYINGRLWDTRDASTNDFEFTKVATPAVSKDEKGKPYLESYGSKEKDDSPVKLGVMCPSTELWQNRIRGIVLRLMNECGVKGVYIDQVAAAQPTLCFDTTHKHPLGGGHWWNEGYWRMMESIRRSMPKDRMLTTECNGEPFIKWFDGYLTWHWQYDGQVPAFPAVYGGAIQMFGRSYGGGPTRDLALRMRAGQQLVFGEQIGWLAPGVVKEEQNAAFLRQVVHLRRQLAKYFYAGEMARPPRLVGPIPKVRADWQWNGVAWVTTDAVLTGAWYQSSAKRVVLIFVNVSEAPVTTQVDFDAKPYGFRKSTLRVGALSADGPTAQFHTASHIRREAVFPPRTAWAWELSAP
jgi:hypothetical protein